MDTMYQMRHKGRVGYCEYLSVTTDIETGERKVFAKFWDGGPMSKRNYVRGTQAVRRIDHNGVMWVDVLP